MDSTVVAPTGFSLGLLLGGIVGWQMLVDVIVGGGIVFIVDWLKGTVPFLSSPALTKVVSLVLMSVAVSVISMLYPDVSMEQIQTTALTVLLSAGAIHAGKKQYAETKAKNGKGIGINGSADH